MANPEMSPGREDLDAVESERSARGDRRSEGGSYFSPVADAIIELGALIARWMGLQWERVALESREQMRRMFLLALLALGSMALLLVGFVMIEILMYSALATWINSPWGALVILGGIHLILGGWGLLICTQELKGDDK